MGEHHLSIALVVAALAVPAAIRAQPAPAAEAAAPAPFPALEDRLAEVMSRQGEAWQALPRVADEARAAAITRTRGPVQAWAWADPSMGCFVLAVRVSGGGPGVHLALRDSFGAAGDDPRPEVAGAELTGWRLDQGTPLRSRFDFVLGAVRGQVRTAGDDATTSTLACFWSEREPALSAYLCDRLAPALEAVLLSEPRPTP
ncbi:hypothetical protein [Haliangium sp.]|uniref:hypothetical protein n=1 Tax=Haliangium sp. TaxID=2663208 RepID=UPI003D10708F